MKVFASCMMVFLLLLTGCESGSNPSTSSDTGSTEASSAPQAGTKGQAGNDPAVETGTVTLEIQGSDSPRTIEIEDVQTGTTLEEVMRSVTQIPISIRGSGVTAFVDSIGEQSASGSEGWVFRVNGVHANQGVGSTVLTPPATITWVYGDASDLISQ
tara:strand:+ start:177 stop:647 length:471 start_codon:yes stop_codon:yes gene_type:complete